MEGTLLSSTSSGSLLLNKRSKSRLPPPPKAAPWLVFQHGEGMKYQALYNPCEPNKKISIKCMPELSGSEKIYWQKPCHQGWIVVLDKEKDDPTCFLWNPLATVAIKLPKLFQGFMDYEIYDCVLTLPPSNELREFMVFFLISHETTSKNLLVFSHPGAKQWRIKCLDENYEGSLEIYSLHYLKGKLYVMCSSSDWHLEIEPKQQQLAAGGGHDKDNQTLSVRQFRVQRFPFTPHAAGITTWSVLVYVESFDHIFQVRIFYGKRGINEARAPASTVQILRLDLSLMAWVDVRSLGDDVLFIGTDSTSSYCSAADMGLLKGCLFYTLPEDKSLYIYEVEDDSITIVLPFPNLPTPWSPGNWMMIPTDNIRNGRKITENLLSRDDKEIEGYKIMVEKLKKTCIDDEAADGQNNNNSTREMEVEVETPPRWDILDNDIVGLIAGYLNPKDYSRFRSLCKRNRSMFPQVYPPRPNVSPALLVFDSFKDDGAIFNFVDPMHNEKYSMKKDLSSEHLLLEATIRFSKYGWLLLISKDMKTPFFYDPLTKVIIRLPNFPDVGHMLNLSGMSFSSSPTSPDCAVFAIQPMNHDAISIYAIKRGCPHWRYLVLENLDGSFVPCFNNPVFFRMEFFCLDYSGTLGRCAVNDNGDNNGLHWGVLRKPLKQFNDAFPSYLVECDGNLLLVNVGPVGETVGVFSLDWTNKVWTKVESLGRHMLFISSTSSFSAIAPPNSQMENKVYFPRLHKDGKGLLFYSLDTGTYYYSISRIQAQEKSIDDPAAPASATNFYDTKEMCNCTWIEPDWSQGNTPIDDPDHLWLA